MEELKHLGRLIKVLIHVKEADPSIENVRIANEMLHDILAKTEKLQKKLYDAITESDKIISIIKNSI